MEENIITTCSKCERPLTEDKAWVSNDMKYKVYCLDCAPDDAIRYKDIIWPIAK